MHVHAYGAYMAIRLQCYCASLRQATRIISQKYDAALAAADLTVTHFTLLTALQENPRARASDLVDVLAMDQTTLSRTFALMERGGLIARHEGEDRRAVHWKLTAAQGAQDQTIFVFNRDYLDLEVEEAMGMLGVREGDGLIPSDSLQGP